MKIFYNPTKYQIFFLLIFMAMIGAFASKASAIAALWGMAMFGLGFLLTLVTRNRDGIAHVFAGYLVGSEVFFRMTWSGLPWDFGKYVVIILLGTALIVDSRQRKLPLEIVVYIIMLLPGIYLTYLYSEDLFTFKKNVFFNMLGPVSLAVGTLYFYRLKMSSSEFINLSRWIALGVFTISIYVFLKVGDYSAIQFTHSSNAASSGGFSGNQVSISFGVGVLIVAINLILNNRLFYYLALDLTLIFIFLFQGLMTFSRGGMSSAILGVLAGAILYYFTNFQQLLVFLRKYVFYLLFGVVFAVSAFTVVDDMTGGFLYERYFNKDKNGNKIKKDVTTGRGDILIGDMMLFESSHYVGVGVGVSKNERPLHRGFAAHVEYTRMLAEHGLLGLVALIMLLFLPLKHFLMYFSRPIVLIVLGTFSILVLTTMTHAAMRLGMVGFFYGMAFLLIVPRSREDG